MTDLAWSSALSPHRPSVPRQRDWTAGLVGAALVATAAAYWYARQDHSAQPVEQEQEERVVVALGSAAQRLETPPAPPKDTPTVDKPPVVAERAKDAPPIAPPPKPRPVMTWTQGNGEFSSGTGGTAATPSPPPPAPPPPPPPPPRKESPINAGAYFDKISTARYSRMIVYPERSLEDGEQGVGVLAVVITPDGTVRSWSLIQSTGKSRLDAEIKRVAGLVRTLDPLPADFPGKRAIVQITITFHIQGPDV